MTLAVECDDLSKNFAQIKAVDDLEVKLEKNKIYGLLGRNGAGKTTWLDLLTAQKLPDKGEIKIFGEKPYGNAAIREQICYIKEDPPYQMWFEDSITVKKLFDTAEIFYPNWEQEYALNLCQEFSLDEDRKYKDLAKGKKSATNIIIGLASRAQLTIFDESYMGLDTPARQQFYDLVLKDYRENPRTFILATHLIDEASKLFDEVLIMEQGNISLQEEAEQIREKAFIMTANKDILLNELEGENIINKEEKGDLLRVDVFSQFSKSEIMNLKQNGITVEKASLAELFSSLTK